jgi:putative transposase
MQRKKYTDEQIIQVFKEGDAGTPVSELCRKYGMSDASYYTWKAKYAGLSVSEIKWLKSLEEENRRLKQNVAEQARDNRAVRNCTCKQFVTGKWSGRRGSNPRQPAWKLLVSG